MFAERTSDVVELGARVGEPSRMGEVRRLTPGLTDGVSSGPLSRRASSLERL
jgi:hypothetical protein